VFGDFGVILPKQLARDRIQRVNHRKPGSEIEHAIGFHRGGEGGARGTDIVVPCESELAHALRVHLFERAEMVLVCTSIPWPMRVASTASQCQNNQSKREV